MDKQIFKVSTTLLLVFIVLVIVVLGFYRDFIFISINNQLDFLANPAKDWELPSSLAFIKALSYQQLFIGKWLLTVAFTLMYFGISCWTIYILFRKKRMLYWIGYSYAALIFLSILLYLMGYLLGNSQVGYKLARIFMGIAQSPIVLMILLPAFKLLQQNNANNVSSPSC